MARAARRVIENPRQIKNDQILLSPIVLPIEKMNQINTMAKNYWK